eukprot:TRINITY_DN23162_c0_g1_i1.p1 TRINITY_DN23162_c0_g1~~TRINITY_DN23162_c0_g1_i1.p1  ORF type:complete len:201 (-),score=47.16 TRINITY_DN23162_c0_g1_i1:150-752(-)
MCIRDGGAEAIGRVVAGGFGIVLRSRLQISVPGEQQPVPVQKALNEVAVTKEHGGSLVQLRLYCDGVFVTEVRADGLVIATPTGSTAYSLAAGGSVVHPSVPAILVTPICPQSLSFRPLMLPDTSTLRVEVSEDSRYGAHVSLDGMPSVFLAREEAILIQACNFPVPTVCNNAESEDWFSSVDSNLRFNTMFVDKHRPRL